MVIDNESIADYLAPAAGFYTLRVYGIGGAENDYGLSMAVTPVIPVCTEDSNENNDTQATATAYPGTAVNGQICTGDPDWYTLVLNNGDSLRAELRFTDANGDFDLAFYDVAGNLLRSAASSTDNEFIDFEVSSAGTYALRVVGYLGAENSYTLDAVVISPTPVCSDDGNEDNDIQATVTSFTGSDDLSGAICAGDDDYYALDLSAGQTLVVNLLFTDDDGDIDLRLLNEIGSTVASSTIGSDDESISYAVRLIGRYTLRVYGYNGAENSYQLRTSVI